MHLVGFYVILLFCFDIVRFLLFICSLLRDHDVSAGLEYFDPTPLDDNLS